jgi:hypothetical protein
VVAATRRNPEAVALMRELDAAASQIRATGINLNQIAFHLNSTGDLRDWPELREALNRVREGADLHKQAVLRVLAL